MLEANLAYPQYFMNRYMVAVIVLAERDIYAIASSGKVPKDAGLADREHRRLRKQGDRQRQLQRQSASFLLQDLRFPNRRLVGALAAGRAGIPEGRSHTIFRYYHLSDVAVNQASSQRH
jgi:hypothetical protein